MAEYNASGAMLNRYVGNDPVNFVDPFGLQERNAACLHVDPTACDGAGTPSDIPQSPKDVFIIIVTASRDFFDDIGILDITFDLKDTRYQACLLMQNAQDMSNRLSDYGMIGAVGGILSTPLTGPAGPSFAAGSARFSDLANRGGAGAQVVQDLLVEGISSESVATAGARFAVNQGPGLLTNRLRGASGAISDNADTLAAYTSEELVTRIADQLGVIEGITDPADQCSKLL